MSETRLIDKERLHGIYDALSEQKSHYGFKRVLDKNFNSLPLLSDLITARTITDAGVFGDMYKHGWNDCAKEMIELVEEKLQQIGG